jgi:anti-sigma regulatory factor (Ser/Thr protein kinase)
MVTNAVRHGQPPVELELVADPDVVTVAVADGSPRAPRRRTAADDAESGRGMALVDVLAEEHGVRPQPPGKAVWAAVRRRPGDAAS